MQKVRHRNPRFPKSEATLKFRRMKCSEIGKLMTQSCLRNLERKQRNSRGSIAVTVDDLRLFFLQAKTLQ